MVLLIPDECQPAEDDHQAPADECQDRARRFSSGQSSRRAALPRHRPPPGRLSAGCRTHPRRAPRRAGPPSLLQEGDDRSLAAGTVVLPTEFEGLTLRQALARDRHATAIAPRVQRHARFLSGSFPQLYRLDDRLERGLHPRKGSVLARQEESVEMIWREEEGHLDVVHFIEVEVIGHDRAGLITVRRLPLKLAAGRPEVLSASGDPAPEGRQDEWNMPHTPEVLHARLPDELHVAELPADVAIEEAQRVIVTDFAVEKIAVDAQPQPQIRGWLDCPDGRFLVQIQIEMLGFLHAVELDG